MGIILIRALDDHYKYTGDWGLNTCIICAVGNDAFSALVQLWCILKGMMYTPSVWTRFLWPPSPGSPGWQPSPCESAPQTRWQSQRPRVPARPPSLPPLGTGYRSLPGRWEERWQDPPASGRFPLNDLWWCGGEAWRPWWQLQNLRGHQTHPRSGEGFLRRPNKKKEKQWRNNKRLQAQSRRGKAQI